LVLSVWGPKWSKSDICHFEVLFLQNLLILCNF
jgi:hypothetical protein